MFLPVHSEDSGRTGHFVGFVLMRLGRGSSSEAFSITVPYDICLYVSIISRKPEIHPIVFSGEIFKKKCNPPDLNFNSMS